jgi:hypothetical protein
MRFAVESWSPEYGMSVEDVLDPTRQPVDPDIEIVGDAWAPIRPPAAAAVRPDRMLFVDGVRRVDARVWIEHGASALPGLCASIAAGVVRVEGATAELVEARVVRGLFCHGSELSPIVTSCGVYEPREVAGDTPEALVIALQDRMAALEIEVTDAAGGADIVVVDGPLRGRSHVPGAVGYVKTQHTQYLPAPLDAVVGLLDVGERTPLFAISGGWTRLSWYARLPGPRTHALAGIVRCEISSGEVEEGRRIADRVTAVLPRFASRPHKDSRAPQNLYPIAGLERALRRRLGDPALLERALRVAAYR